ncbi:multicopper oxidase-domain-containing protein [Mucor mucedo]|uniref:multicopper oxidase-domain-containing protein n=1 Tax=Mucor mucedo TaxID=29922 RepID=UPI0022210880|nr:multicopper oxidase-domain-containing protein [Mucor mucedo]KAI7887914.1 multicopper oxidase-domain-containing protein [Mucor mucedo]
MLIQFIGIVIGTLTLCQAELHRYEFNVTSGSVNPDCFEKGVVVPHINGQFPGPTIHAQVGDELEILVRNQLESYNTSIHYHGIRQIGSAESDGVPGVTQHPISPGDSYLQRFKVTQQAGTYFYHAHVGLQDDSVQGSFIVYESDTANPKKVAPNTLLKAGPYEYKKDILLQLSEWWHEELDSRQDYYTSKKFTYDHGSDSILINGRTVHDPTANSEKSCQGYTTFDVEPNTTYRLRVIGANSFRTLALAIKEHNMTMIEVDGELVHPYDTSFLEITPGQRFSVLLKTADHPPGTTFAIGTSYLWRQRGRGITENGFGYIRYVRPEDVTDENNSFLFKPIRKWANNKHNFNKEGNFNKRAEWLGAERAAVDHSPKADAGSEHKGGNHGADEHSGGEQKDDGHKKGDRANGEHKGKEGKEGGGGRPGGGGGGGGGRPKKVVKTYVDLPTFPKMDEPDWVWRQLIPLAERDPILDETDVRTIKLHTTSVKLADNTTHYLINQRFAPMPALPLVSNFQSLGAANYSDDDQQFNSVLNTYHVSHNEVVDFVFQNTKNAIGGCLLHPWHTHGHSHYVIASGVGSYEHDLDKDIRNFEHPLLKDTTVAYPSIPSNDTDGCGWTKVRIIADNPGFWAIHCHITTHMIQGKMIILEEAPELISEHSLYARLD